MSFSDHPITDSAFTISDLIGPDSTDSPNAADFIGMVEVKSTVEAEQRGAAAEIATAAEMLPSWKDQTSGVLVVQT